MRRAVALTAVLVGLLGVALLRRAEPTGELATALPLPPTVAVPLLEAPTAASPDAAGGSLELLVQTRVAGRPVDVGLALTCGDAVKTVGGQVLVKGLAEGECTVSIATGEWSAGEQTVTLTEPRTVLAFELRKSAWLTVKGSAPSAGPFEISLVNFELSSVTSASSFESVVLGPVPEGDYLLQVTGEDLVTYAEEVSLEAGQNTVEVVLSAPTRLRGVVRDELGKAVEGARVGAVSKGQLGSDALTAADGHFELTMSGAGETTVRAERADVGSVERIVVPGAENVLTLGARGVIEVELFALDGKRRSAELWVKPTGEGRVVTTSMRAPWPLRIAGLSTGEYVIQHSEPGLVPIAHRVKVVEGQTTRVRLREEAGVRVVGQVLDDRGEPAGHVTIAINGQGPVALTKEDGRFSFDGVAPGKVQLGASQGHEVLSDWVEFVVPQANVVLRLPPPLRVAGTLVDSSGKPLREFTVNRLTFVDSTTGRFDVPAPDRTLEVHAEGFAPRLLRNVQGGLGTVVLEPAQFVDGVVVDEAGRAVPGATVSVGESTEAVSEADGHFRFPLQVADAEEVVASRGERVGRVALSTKEKLRVVLRPEK